METLRRTVLEMAADFNKQMEAFQRECQTSVLQGASPNTKLMSDFASFRSFTMSSLKILQSKVEVMFSTCDKLEMPNRKKILLLHGVPETNEEDPSKIVSGIFDNQVLLSNIPNKRCNRLGKVRSQKPQAILIKLQNSSDKSKLWNAKSKLKNTGYTLSEFLTPSRRAVVLAARQCYGITSCWTKDGTIVIREQDGWFHHITSLGERDVIQGLSNETSADICSRAPTSAPDVKRARSVAAKSKKVTKNK